jgi:hypothetical protein
MSEKVPQQEQTPEKTTEELLAELRAHPYIVSAEASPYKAELENYHITPEREESLKSELGASYSYVQIILDTCRDFLSRPLITDTFGNYHIQESPNHENLSRKDFVRSFGKGTPLHKLLDTNRLKFGTIEVNILSYIEALPVLSPDSAFAQELNEMIPEELRPVHHRVDYKNLKTGEEQEVEGRDDGLSEEQKMYRLSLLDAFALKVVEKICNG